ncbi:MAG: pyridoxal phosphate-dependent aminotransferase family protein [Imperialibacter sp.]|uniref:aminotransferase class I/II-fold pyridoxal phosphate-dependent enzyme n=1 Tax=Imperialibacter sp. TaxID=2038411 RepID=UPI0032EE7CBC
MNDKLRKRTSTYQEPQKVKRLGQYPFFRPIESEQGTEVTIDGHQVLMFGSNSYLGLTNHPKVMEASAAAIKKYGTGCAGSRFLNGTLDLHVELENRLAKFLNKEAVLVYTTGFQVNLGVIPCLTTKEDTIILDEFDHASIIEGSRLSFARKLKFRHNDMDALEKKLQMCDDSQLKLIVVDGVFSMEGDIANLPEIVRLANKYGATIMTDCAHAIGVLGKNGAGTSSHFGLDNEVDLIGGTFSKSLASIGGFVASDADTINYLKHHSRALIFSASMPASTVASVLAVLDLLESDDSLIAKLWDNTHHAHRLFREYGIDIGKTETPIIPIYVRNFMKTFELTTELFKAGLFVNPVIPPAVGPEDTMIRFSLMASHTKEQIDIAVEKIYKTMKKLGIETLQDKNMAAH